MRTKAICKIREAYAIETGDYAGQVFVVIDIGETVGCLSLPSMDNVHIPKKSFISGRNTGIITLIERIPRSTFKVSKAQYIKNENLNHRRK
jgi:hypothetical protein